MTTMTRRRAAGFTLIELLVVIGLLAVLAALGTGAYFRVRTSQQVKGTEDTVAKHSTGFQQTWSAELDNARDSFAGKNNFGQFAGQVETTKVIAGGDVERARALWTYLWMKNAFPQTFAEAINPTRLVVGANTVSLPARRMFTDIPFVAPATVPLVPNTALSNPDQAAVLLYKILSQGGARGAAYSDEATGTLSVQLTDTLPTPPPAAIQYRVFTDSFGNPITYVFSSSGNQNDLNTAEYTKGNNPSRDPFDPTGRLLAASWTVAASRTAAASSFGLADFTNTNWQPTIVARGPERTWGTLLATPTGLVPIPDGFTAGYKLRRPGNRGNQ